MNYFTEKELACPCCDINKFNPITQMRFNRLRKLVGVGLLMSSGYRCAASQIISDILKSEGYWFRYKTWIWSTRAFGGGEARKNGLY